MFERVKSFLGLMKKSDGLDNRKQNERTYVYFCKMDERGRFKDETKSVSVTYRVGNALAMSYVMAVMSKSRSQYEAIQSWHVDLNDTVMTNIEYFAKHGRVDITEYNSFKEWLMNNKDHPEAEVFDPIPFPKPVSPIAKPEKKDESVCAIVDRLEVYERGSLADKTKDIVIIYHHAGSDLPKTVHFAMEKARVSQSPRLVGHVYPLNDDIRRFISTLPSNQNVDITGYPSLGDYILEKATYKKG